MYSHNASENIENESSCGGRDVQQTEEEPDERWKGIV